MPTPRGKSMREGLEILMILLLVIAWGLAVTACVMSLGYFGGDSGLSWVGAGILGLLLVWLSCWAWITYAER